MAKLYIVPTPIGNLGDMTYRSVEILSSVDMILAEDTRKSGILLKHYLISKPLSSYHSHNEHHKINHLIRQISSGKSMALITDAGTPGISDPGFLIVRACIENHIPVECLPGATAFVPALINSGFPADRFIFEGFLPVKKSRQSRLKELSQENKTLIFYESPHRLMRTLSDFKGIFGEDRLISISRELTKIHEQTLRGSINELEKILSKSSIKGELVIVVSTLRKL